MSEDERELLKDLRLLAAEGPRQAPARVEARLLAEFDRRKRQRRLMLWLPAGSLAAVAAGLLLLFGLHVSQPKATSAQAAVTAAEDETAFFPLPEAEALPPLENAMVVRVQVPVSSLRLMGVPVNEEDAGTDVQADLLLGQDGLARGVRLAQ